MGVEGGSALPRQASEQVSRLSWSPPGFLAGSLFIGDSVLLYPRLVSPLLSHLV